MKKLCFTGWFVLTTLIISKGQDKQIIDSLRKEVYKDMPDTARVILMIEGFAKQY